MSIGSIMEPAQVVQLLSQPVPSRFQGSRSRPPKRRKVEAARKSVNLRQSLLGDPALSARTSLRRLKREV
jgi:hypothetical protein